MLVNFIRVFVGTGVFGGHRLGGFQFGCIYFAPYGNPFLAESLSAVPGTAEFRR